MMGPYERLLAEMEADWSRAPVPRPGWRKAADGLACAAGGLAWR
jgi:phytoene synthase